MTSRHRTLRSLRHCRSSPVYVRSDSLLLGPGGQIVAAAPAKDDPHVTGLMPEAAPGENDPGGGLAKAGKQEQPSPSSATTSVSNTSAAPTGSSIGPASSQTTGSSSLSGTATAALSSSMISASTPIANASAASSSVPPVTTTSTTSSPSSTSATSAMATVSSTTTQLSQATAMASIMSSSPAHNSRLHLGAAIGAAAGFVSLVTLLVWLIRYRNRSRREKIRSNSKWPWDRDGRSIEDGLGRAAGSGFGFRSAWVGSMDEKRPMDIRSPPVVLNREGVAHSTYDVPIGQSPYTAVHRSYTYGSVPDLAPNLGKLQVTNYAPGDMSSDESSRCTSRAESLIGPSRAPSRMSRRYTPSPWKPPPFEPDNALLIYQEEEKEPIIDVTALPELPLPGDMTTVEPETKIVAMQDGWAATFRSSFVNVFQSVLGGPTVLTTSPIPSHSISPSPKVPSAISNGRDDVPYSECTSEPSVVDNRYRDDLASKLTLALEEIDNVARPIPAVVKSRDRSSQGTGSVTVSRASSVYSTASVVRSEDSSAYTLPEIPSLSRTGSHSSLHEAVQNSELHTRPARRMTRTRTKTAKRPTFLRRTTTNSVASAGFDMSRTSSAASGPLSDEELYAQEVLRERRKRVTAAKVNSVKQSLRRPDVRRKKVSRRTTHRTVASVDNTGDRVQDE